MKRKYHGWIYVEKSNGLKDHFRAQYRGDDGNSRVVSFGYGRAAEAVDFFETAASVDESQRKVKGLNLGPVKLEPTPLGLRVFTEAKQAILEQVTPTSGCGKEAR